MSAVIEDAPMCHIRLTARTVADAVFSWFRGLLQLVEPNVADEAVVRRCVKLDASWGGYG